jgi:hypothetical protein
VKGVNMMKPKYPIYIISKGRFENGLRLTQELLERLGVPYRMVVEDSEFDAYAENVPEEKIIALPRDFRENPLYAVKCEVTKTLGGSIPVRNFVYEHSKSEGHKRHWILDDNMAPIYRLHQNRKLVVESGSPFRILENFVDRYTNIGMAGMNYDFIIPAISKRPPYVLNTRIYSCILLDNTLDIRWRGMYNEDTDISIRMLKADYCTMLFNCFLIGKSASMTMKGGNTTEVYEVDAPGGKESRSGEKFDKRRKFAESIQAQHPDVARITWKYDRWHHYVDYYRYKQKPILKSGLNIPKGTNEYGLVLKEFPKQSEKEVQYG